MAIDYSTRLKNLQARKFDKSLNESLTSRAFSQTDLPKDIKYLLEITRPLGVDYNDRTLEAARRVKNHLETGFTLSFRTTFRHQGSVTTNTNIKTHSDFDLLTIIDNYYYTAPEIPVNSPYEGNASEDIEDLRKEVIRILKTQYDDVDITGSKSVSIFNKSLYRKVDIVPCFWYNSTKYESTKNEYYRGIYLYDFKEKKKIQDYPFAHIWNVNHKGDSTNDGSKKGIRLLKNLKADSENKLSSFQLTSIIHSIDNINLPSRKGSEIVLAKSISNELNLLINNSTYRNGIKSPNGMENPFTDSNCVLEMEKIKNDIDTLITDVSKEFRNTYLQKSITSY